jgi:shikimate dehydrogenase
MPLRDKSHTEVPLLPYEHFTANHIAFDLIYNPAETQFLKSKDGGAQIKNGLDMLVFFRQKSVEDLTK